MHFFLACSYGVKNGTPRVSRSSIRTIGLRVSLCRFCVQLKANLVATGCTRCNAFCNVRGKSVNLSR